MKHRGEIVEKAVRESGYSITKLAERLGISRRHIYNLFDNAKIDWDTVSLIGTIIRYDFSKDFTELQAGNFASEPLVSYTAGEKGKGKPGLKQLQMEVTYWKHKYIELLEKYNQMLQEVNVKKKAR
jgi:hypothetical protein